MIEQSGLLAFDAPGGRFTVTAKADRIEFRGEMADIPSISKRVRRLRKSRSTAVFLHPN